ncbi:MAG: DUF5694 domain-containing protein [Gemmatimonadales bacterium]
MRAPGRRWGALGLALVAGLTAPPVASAQAPSEAEVLVLGTYHFANPGRDVVKLEVADVLGADKQAEIGRVVEALTRFRPTKIVVERTPARAAELDSLYRAYRSGRHTLSRNEIQQLGFRIAAGLGHERLYPADHPGEFPFDALMAYAQAHDTAFVRFVGEELARIGAEANRLQSELTIGGILRAMNDPADLARGHGLYLRFARVGAGDGFVGADLVAKWYERNIRIFANLRRATEPGDRVLVIFGAGHAPILRELVAADPGLTLVDPLEFLPAR